ncbi:MAG: NADH-quinone oxidoreductase subunit C [Alphaproteobacteria bacterium]
MAQTSRALQNSLVKALKKDILESTIQHGDVSITVSRENIVKVLTYLRDAVDHQFRILLDITAVDYPERNPRFEVVYILLSISTNQRLRVKLKANLDEQIPTVTSVFGSANWAERETWDMFGLKFAGHPDMRRLLTDYNFEGHPLRKDFPLTGYVEVRYDNEQRRVVYEPVKLQQEFRSFDFMSPWEGMTTEMSGSAVLPGDEKAAPEPANDTTEEGKKNVGT